MEFDLTLQTTQLIVYFWDQATILQINTSQDVMNIELLTSQIQQYSQVRKFGLKLLLQMELESM